MTRKEKKKKKFIFWTKGSCDFIILVVVLLILSLGLIMVLSASSPASLSESGTSYKYFYKQLIATAIGLIGMVVLSKIDYKIYRKFSWLIYIICMAVLILVGVAGEEAGGARRWFRIAGYQFQPSEFAKIGFVLFYAELLTKLKQDGKIGKFGWGFVYPIALFLPIAFVLYKMQNHFSATFLIGVVTCIQMFIAGVKFRYFLLTGALGASALGGALFVMKGNSAGAEGIAQENFRAGRIQTWLDPFSDPTGDGWQIIQSLYAIASGGMFGVGLGESKQKYLYLPEPHNDFIFAVLAEELGFFGCVMVITLFAIFVWRGIIICMRAPDTFGSLVAIGIVSLIGIQAIVNIAVVTGTVPVTGMPLPFFSYGGTAIIANLMAVGILLNISRSCSQK